MTPIRLNNRMPSLNSMKNTARSNAAVVHYVLFPNYGNALISSSNIFFSILLHDIIAIRSPTFTPNYSLECLRSQAIDCFVRGILLGQWSSWMFVSCDTCRIQLALLPRVRIGCTFFKAYVIAEENICLSIPIILLSIVLASN